MNIRFSEHELRVRISQHELNLLSSQKKLEKEYALPGGLKLIFLMHLIENGEPLLKSTALGKIDFFLTDQELKKILTQVESKKEPCLKFLMNTAGEEFLIKLEIDAFSLKNSK